MNNDNMKKRKAREPSENRQQIEARILRASEKIFASKGFSGSSMDAIADEAKLSKQNLIYYFPSKKVLYAKVLEHVLDLWIEKMHVFEEPGLSPREIMERYIKKKLQLSRDYPDASKVFAHEIINGAPVLRAHILEHAKPQFERDVAVINSWIEQGLIKPVSPQHLFFGIWASTQTYADFATQIQLLLGKPSLDDSDFENAWKFISQSILEPFFTE
ncbi:TetR family transcriptional regulator C-terminal domain-containing protein [Agarilytica rhodophyticola]|uniref:TetR family transcriptional regulator C-terminal domain-containing protein n=1 Tax=Agarilytica rhodophyticola TaxID=1737490 RepID=UPI001C1FDBBB|nr:TetR family transcriptional regulator C-terminal domain-containing protein [Agarilytica rhodophyticola]